MTTVHKSVSRLEPPSGVTGGGRRTARRPDVARLLIPHGVAEATLTVDGRSVQLTSLRKVFWPRPGLTKRDLLQYYVDVSTALLPHLRGRPMVLKRYPHGAGGDFFFMKHAPEPRPDWVETCPVEHAPQRLIEYVVVKDLASLLWVVNLGCVDLNQWYAPCGDVGRPDYLHFDLDPGAGAAFRRVLDAALLVRAALKSLRMPAYVKTTGSRGLHVYVPIKRGPTQKQVWAFAKQFALALASHDPKLFTAEYRVARRPRGAVLIDYNQNAWGRTLASVYSVRPTPRAAVSTPVTWEEVEGGIRVEDFRVDNVPARVRRLGDLWRPLLEKRGRVDLTRLMGEEP